MKLLLATTNPGKTREMREALEGLHLDLRSLSEIQAPPAPFETGSSFAANALLKARYYSQATGMPALADDSGLCIDALGGAPGVGTARIADSADGIISWILEQLASVAGPDRTAHFVCALCLYISENSKVEVEGRVPGLITRSPRGRGGFGQDPIFYHAASGKTFAELTLSEKNRISHRAEALRKLRAALLDRP